jgi:hypothetical protein
MFKLDLEIIKTNFQTNLQDTWIKTVATSVNKIFYIFSSGDLVCHPIWPMFKLIRAKTYTSILTKFDDNWVRNVTTRMLIRFSQIWAVWPSFPPQVTHIRTWPRNHQNKLSDNLQDIWIKTVATKVLTRANRTRWCSPNRFWTQEGIPLVVSELCHR